MCIYIYGVSVWEPEKWISEKDHPKVNPYEHRHKAYGWWKSAARQNNNVEKETISVCEFAKSKQGVEREKKEKEKEK